MTHNEHMQQESQNFTKYFLQQSPSCPVAALQLVENFIEEISEEGFFDRKIKVGKPIKYDADELSQHTEYILGVSILDTEILYLLPLIVGYVGETIRSALGGNWHAEKKENEYLIIGNRKVDIRAELEKRIFFAPDRNLVTFYLNLKQSQSGINI